MESKVSDYAFRAHLVLPLAAAYEQVVAALKTQGFGVLTDVDVKATMQKRLGVDFREYRILGVCNPPLAHKALSANLDVGLLLPCNVILYEEGDGTEIAILDPLSMLGIASDFGLDAVADEARSRLERVAAVLQTS